MLALHRLLGGFEGGIKIVIERAQHIHPVGGALLDIIELSLHLCREIRIHNMRKMLLHHLGRDLTEHRRLELLAVALDIHSRQDRGDGRRIGRRTADAVFFKCLDEGGFGESWRGLRKMLVAFKADDAELILHFQRREHLLILLLGLVLLLIKHGKSVKLHGIARCLEGAFVCVNIHGNGIKQRIGHLAGDEALPDELIQLELVVCQIVSDLRRRQIGHGRTDGFMRILCALLGLEDTRLVGQVAVSPCRLDVIRCRLLGICRNTQRIGTHVGNQADSTHAVNIHAFIQLLCGLHGTLRLEAETLGRLLLQGRGDERRCRLLLRDALLDRSHDEIRLLQPFEQAVRLCLVFNFDLLAVHSRQLGIEGLVAARGGEYGINAPVFLRLKCPDLFLTIHDQADCHRLHTPCRQAALDLFPQERAELVAHKTVKDAPRLLGIDKVNVDAVRVGHTCLHTGLGDLVEGNAVVGVHVEL